MRPGPFRSAALGFLIGAVALTSSSGCSGNRVADKSKFIQVDFNILKTKYPKAIRIKTGQKVRWTTRWDRLTLKIDWKTGETNVPFKIRCEGPECFAEEGARNTGVFRYEVRVFFYGSELPPIDPDVIVEGMF